MDIEGAEVDVLLNCAGRLDDVGQFVCGYHSLVRYRQRPGELLAVLEAGAIESS